MIRPFLNSTRLLQCLQCFQPKIFFYSQNNAAAAMSTDVNPAEKPAVTSNIPQYETLELAVPKPFVYHVQLRRPEKLNSINKTMWIEIGKCFNELADNADCRVVVLSGAGKHFSAGIDLTDMAQVGSELGLHEDVARRCKILRKMISTYQDSITSLEKCYKPVIGAIHGACIGGGFDLVSATDIRFCTGDAWFQIKEVDIGMAADVGTLQRLPRIIGSASLVSELAFTARKLLAEEAKQCGFVSKVFPDRDSMMQGSLELAEKVAEKSPLAVQGTKMSLIYSRDHSVQEGLDQIALWNQTMLQSEDFLNASIAQATKGPPPTFSKL